VIILKLPKKIVVCEVGPRDGFQNEKGFIPTEKKVEIINKVADAGFKVIEIGSFVHPKAVPQLIDIDEVATLINRKQGVEYRALVTNVKGVERAIKAGVNKIKLAVSASESHNLSNFNRKPEETIEGFKQCITLARGNDISVSAAIATSFGCPFEGKIPAGQIEKLVKCFLDFGINEISLSDTTGMANPTQVNNLCSQMIEKFPEVKWILHFHNTRGMALANILAGIEAGATWFDGAFSGLGGCPYAPGASGNVASEDLIHMCDEMGIETGIDLDKAIEIARVVKECVGHETDSYMLKAGKAKDLIPDKPKTQSKK